LRRAPLAQQQSAVAKAPVVWLAQPVKALRAAGHVPLLRDVSSAA
jgi:hypothetical protein